MNGEQNAHQDLPERLLQSEQRMAAMIEVGRSLTAIHDLDMLLVRVVELVTGIMRADRSTIFLVDHAHGEIWSKVAQGEQMREIRLPVGEGLSGWVAENGKNINLKDAYQDDRFDPSIDRETGYHTGSVLCVPLRGQQGEILGVVQSLNKKDNGYFSKEDERLLEALGSQISIAIENAQLVLGILSKNIELVETQEALAKKVEELDVLFRLEREISTADRPDEIVTRLLRRAVDMVECEAGSVLLLSQDETDLIFSSAVGSVAEAVKRVRLRRGSGVAGWVTDMGQSLIIDDASRDSRHSKELEAKLDFPVRSILAVPLAMGGERIGALELLNKRDGGFSQEDEKLATLIAGRAVAALQVEKQREQREKETRLASIGQALSGVIHDFRTPMTIISGYVQLIAMEENQAKREAHSEVILNQFDFINSMTKELLAFARGETSLLLHKVYTDRLLSEMKEILTRELEGAGVRLVVDDQYEGPVRVDENKLRRMIFNISRNARQAMPAGGQFSICLSDAAESVRFDFIDTGVGIPDDIQDSLFESFVTKGKADGTGLGLAVVKKIVDEHNGRIEVSNQESGGARFSIWIPKRLEKKD